MPLFVPRFTSVFALLWLAIAFVVPLRAQAAAPVKTVVFATGSAVPGAGVDGSQVPAGATFVSFSGYVDDGAGHSAFLGTWTSPTGRGSGVFHNGQPVAVVGGPAQTGAEDGAKFATFGQPLVSSAGVAFSATVRGPRVHPRLLKSIWSNTREGQLRPHFKRTDAPPDVPNGLIDSVISFSLRDAELVALVNYVIGRGGVTAATRTALILSSPTRYEKLLRTGEQLNILDTPSVLKISAFTPSALAPGHDRGHAAGIAVVQVLCSDKRRLNLAVLSATERRVMASNDNFSPYRTLGLPTAASPNVTGFAANRKLSGLITTAKDEVIAAGDSEFSLNPVLFEGDNATPLLKIGTFADPIFNAEGFYAFQCVLTGLNLTAKDNRALIFSDGTPAAALARLNEIAPDADGERRFDVRYQKFLALGLPDGPHAAPVWLARLVGPNVDARNNLGLFARDSAGVIRCLLRTEDSLPVGSASKTVATFTALSGGTFPIGGRRAYGQAGTIAALVTFTDRTTAVVKVTY